MSQQNSGTFNVGMNGVNITNMPGGGALKETGGLVEANYVPNWFVKDWKNSDAYKAAQNRGLEAKTADELGLKGTPVKDNNGNVIATSYTGKIGDTNIDNAYVPNGQTPFFWVPQAKNAGLKAGGLDEVLPQQLQGQNGANLQIAANINDVVGGPAQA